MLFITDFYTGVPVQAATDSFAYIRSYCAYIFVCMYSLTSVLL